MFGLYWFWLCGGGATNARKMNTYIFLCRLYSLHIRQRCCLYFPNAWMCRIALYMAIAHINIRKKTYLLVSQQNRKFRSVFFSVYFANQMFGFSLSYLIHIWIARGRDLKHTIGTLERSETNWMILKPISLRQMIAGARLRFDLKLCAVTALFNTTTNQSFYSAVCVTEMIF